MFTKWWIHQFNQNIGQTKYVLLEDLKYWQPPDEL